MIEMRVEIVININILVFDINLGSTSDYLKPYSENISQSEIKSRIVQQIA